MRLHLGLQVSHCKKRGQLCHAKFAACELSPEHLADTTGSRNVNDWNKPLRSVPKMNLFDTVVQLPKFFTLHSGHSGAVRKGDHTASRERLVWKSRRHCSLSWGWNSIFNLIIILHKYHRSLFQNITQWLKFLIQQRSPHPPPQDWNVTQCPSISQLIDNA